MSTKVKKSLWSGTKLRMQLFRVWFMKNILVWVQCFLIVCIVCIMTGNITEGTPILGKFVYPVFKPLVDEIVLIVEDRQIDGLMDFFAIVISLLTSIGVFTLKLRSIAQTDIKNDKLKIALIKANLYFNADGKLVKKTEKMVGQDLDGDGKISDEEAPITEGLFSGIFTAVKEFHTIATVDLSNPETNEENYKNALEEANLTASEEALKEIDNTISRGTTVMVIDGLEREVERKERKVKKDKTLSKAKKVQKENLLVRLKNMLKRKKKQVIEASEAKEDVVVNNVEVDAVVKVKKETKTQTATEVIKEMTTTKKVETKKEQKVSTNKKATDVLADLLK